MTCTKQFSTSIPELAEIKAAKMAKRLGHPLYVYPCPEHEGFYHLTSHKRSSRGVQRSGAWKKAKRRLRPQIDVWESEGGSIRS